MQYYSNPPDDTRYILRTLSCLLPLISIDYPHKILPTSLSFEVNIIDVLHFYEFKCKLCVEEIRCWLFTLRYRHNNYLASLIIFLRCLQCIRNECYCRHSYHHFLSIPPFNQRWFCNCWPINFLRQEHSYCKILVLQTLRNIQGQNIFLDLGMISNTMCKSVFVWRDTNSLPFYSWLWIIWYWLLTQQLLFKNLRIPLTNTLRICITKTVNFLFSNFIRYKASSESILIKTITSIKKNWIFIFIQEKTYRSDRVCSSWLQIQNEFISRHPFNPTSKSWIGKDPQWCF